MVIDTNDKIIPKYKAWFLFTFPVGIGLKQVLLIRASKSESYHMFNAPAAPEPIATANKEISDDDKSTFEGAIKRPTMQVNKTRDITLGFIKLKNDCKLNAKLNLGFLDFIIIWLNLFYFRQLFKRVERRRRRHCPF